ncbi:sugar phosphate isomerase [Levilactobacillus enshiensis]|uniref:sugar phosphate isomerase n=1 Tax=Levilactobacillus enshiensis TaxID=2590213 RepID=UPI00117BCAA2|nr:sugar phosphate isomerase [Levilactobacillus enshiensis]
MFDRNRLVLNTLVSQQQQQQGQSQLKLVTDLLTTGIRNIELRREYNAQGVSELHRLNQLRLANRLIYFYSVPDNLFVDHRLNQHLLQYISEAQLLGASYLKMTLGDFEQTTSATQIPELLALLPNGMELNIENDQTSANSDVAKLMAFFDLFDQYDRRVGFVNDLGNWIFTDQDALTTTAKLVKDTRFVHLKSYVLQNTTPTTVSFTQGALDWQTLLAKFSTTIPVALEYPTNAADLQRDMTTLFTSGD